MLRKLIWFAITSGLAAQAWKAWREHHAHRAGRDAAVPPEAIHTWEGEGGSPIEPARPAS